MIQRSTSRLQRRISAAMTAVVILFVAVQGDLAYGALEQQEDDLVDDVVRAETRRLAGRLSSGEVRSTAFDRRIASHPTWWHGSLRRPVPRSVTCHGICSLFPTDSTSFIRPVASSTRPWSRPTLADSSSIRRHQQRGVR